MRYCTAGMLLAATLLAACASEVKREPVGLTASVPESGRRYELGSAVSFVLDSRQPRMLAAGTEFAVAGRVPQGLVLRPTQVVLTVEGAHMHEAYAVVAHDGRLVGFYLPVEKAFSPLQSATPFPLVERK